MNVVQQPKADSTPRQEAPGPEAVTRVQSGVWGAVPTRRYDDLARRFGPFFGASGNRPCSESEIARSPSNKFDG